MVNLLRRFQQPLMIFVTVLIIISFTWFYSRNDFVDHSGAGHVAMIYGKPVSFAQTQKIGRKFELCQDLGLMDLLQSLAIRQEDAKINFLWNSLVLKQEADNLGIQPTDDEIEAAIKGMRVFQTNGVYDSSRYARIVEMALNPRGFTAGDMEDLIKDDLRLKKIKEVLGSTVAPSDAELRDAYGQQSQQIEASVVRLKLDDFLASTQVSDEDLKKTYEERKGGLKTDEARKVKYVAFILPTTDKPLEPKDRAEALGKLGKQAEDFSVAMTEKDAKMEEVAAKFGVKVEETADFIRANPPEQLGNSPAASATAFKLTKDQPVGDIVSTDRGYYILQLAGITAPRPLTFEEAKDRLAEEVKKDRANEALSLKATEIRNKIDTEIKAGKSFADAAQAAGAKVETIPPFSRQELQIQMQMMRFAPAEGIEAKAAALELNAGQLSSPVPTAKGSEIVYVQKLLPMDEEKFKTEKSQVADNLVEFQKAILFSEWLKLRKAASGLQTNYRG